ncbi:MAG: nitroreductase family protein [Bacteroidales bacterium]|nr:nitroreductase family protein [Bacteroidales bacterium]
MNIRELVLKTRSYRRFDESYQIEIKKLEELVDLARLSASASNRQPLKYILCNSRDCCGKIFPCLAWAGYLKDWDGPVPGERPSAYIIILGDKTVAESFNVDHGIAAQSIMLGASESGLGGCMIASIRGERLRKEINIPENFEILLVLALGKPVENVIIDEVKDGDIKYWRDNDQNHHVPKRKLEDVIIKV